MTIEATTRPATLFRAALAEAQWDLKRRCFASKKQERCERGTNILEPCRDVPIRGRSHIGTCPDTVKPLGDVSNVNAHERG